MTRGRRMLGVIAATVVALFVPSSALAAPAQFDEYYVYFDTGPKWQPYAHTSWVPQGLTKLDENTLIISYYDHYESARSIVALMDRATGTWLRTYPLDITGHVGGIAMTSGHLWVADGTRMRRYPRSQLSRTGGTPLAATASFPVAASSYAFADGETLWVGHFNPDARDYMYSYPVVGGSLPTKWVDRVYTPSRVQGVILFGNRIVWSQSYGRDNDSQLIYWPRTKVYNGSSAIGRWLVAPNMSQGLVMAGGRVQVIFESCSSAYDGTVDGNAADYIVCSVHHGPFLSLP